MKVYINFKTPDALRYALEDVPEDEREVTEAQLENWIEYGESITVEFDLEKNTAKVIKR